MRTASGGLLLPRRHAEGSGGLLFCQEVISFTRPGIVHTVRQLADGTWDCTCEHFTFTLQECKHIASCRESRTRRVSRETHPG